MKNLYFLLLALSFFNVTNAQIVDIPDVNFKAILLATNSTNGIAEHLTGGSMKIDVNNDKQIQVSEALKVGSLNIPDKNITSLVGIQSFSNLQTLNCRFNKLTSLNVTGLTNLRVLYCNTNQLISLTVTGLTKL